MLCLQRELLLLTVLSQDFQPSEMFAVYIKKNIIPPLIISMSTFFFFFLLMILLLSTSDPDLFSVRLWPFLTITLKSQISFKCKNSQVHYIHCNSDHKVIKTWKSTLFTLKYQEIRFNRLSSHIQHLTHKLKIQLGFLYRIKGCLFSSNCKTILHVCFWLWRYCIISVSLSILGHWNAEHHSAVHFIMCITLACCFWYLSQIDWLTNLIKKI